VSARSPSKNKNRAGDTPNSTGNASAAQIAAGATHSWVNQCLLSQLKSLGIRFAAHCQKMCMFRYFHTFHHKYRRMPATFLQCCLFALTVFSANHAATLSTWGLCCGEPAKENHDQINRNTTFVKLQPVRKCCSVSSWVWHNGHTGLC
jgi:hypothetical protein